MDRKQQQAELIYKLGLLLAPIDNLVREPEKHTTASRSLAVAEFASDVGRFIDLVRVFATVRPGLTYSQEATHCRRTLSVFQSSLSEIRDDTARLANGLEKVRVAATRSILEIPAELSTDIMDANSPFQAYCKLKAIFETTANSVFWADPYMGPGLFHRYLNALPESVEVTLVTKDRSNHAEYRTFLDISKLYAAERGPTKYRLFVESSNHDRWLRCDDQLYHLGGSAKDAGQRSPFTISIMESSPANFQRLTDLVDNGREVFGPSTHNHP